MRKIRCFNQEWDGISPFYRFQKIIVGELYTFINSYFRRVGNLFLFLIHIRSTNKRLRSKSSPSPAKRESNNPIRRDKVVKCTMYIGN